MLKGVHFLLTYKCNLECDQCFVWGSPKSKSTFMLAQIRMILAEARKLETVDFVSIEGGEPFLYYPIMVKTAKEAVSHGFQVEIITNCYWATSPEDAVEWLLPLSEAKNVKLSFSSDLYHGDMWESEQVRNAVKASKSLNMKSGVISVKHPEIETPRIAEIEGAKVDFWELMCRGRAVSKLTEKAPKKSWLEFTKCPYEDFVNQERIHIDPFGHVHVCQGISIGNAWRKPFSEIIREYDPWKNPILEPLVRGGPVSLVDKFGLPHEEAYVDACHLCYAARCMLRRKYPDILTPNQMYGEIET
jgi:MoaA/NifB/PqqE/SkfB family radical SAM enzyme